ncbi:unnamed protein product [Caenorhabditis bovis]|uniref:Major facilitator superfamily (MFS) profile domain-containing protein n=1 Tax=Caenorhabditis bovis TaxID=2654633 RepID=A0A8S1EKZ6_9PELO|nr:unnamed protein product [Caenorhabditis bovis]
MSNCKLWSIGSLRLRVVCAIALALTIEGLMRSNLNMAIVCMLNSTALSDGRSSLHNANETTTPHRAECPMLVMGSKEHVDYHGTIFWSSQERAVIFASFYVGGLAATLFSEKLIRCVGSTKTVLYGAIANVLGTFVTPFVASHSELGTSPLIMVRFIMGFGQGVLWPCMSVLIAHWFPVEEKSTALAIATTGNQLSVVIAMFATAELCQLPLGWPMAFHVYGVLGIALCIIWWLFVYDTPADAAGVISSDELEHISKLGKKHRPVKANWKALLTSPVVWAVAASSFAHNYITVGIITYLPLYYKTVLNMSLTSNGVLSAIPFVGQFVSKVAYASIADQAKARKWMSVDAVTKISNSSASFGIAICFGILCFCDCSNRVFAIFLIFMAMAFVSGYIPGYNTSVVTIAPSQTAAIASYTRLWAQIASSLAPYLIGATTKQGSAEEWRIVFLVIVLICVVTGAFFQCFGSADIQSWDFDESRLPAEIAREELIDRTKYDETAKVINE